VDFSLGEREKGNSTLCIVCMYKRACVFMYHFIYKDVFVLDFLFFILFFDIVSCCNIGLF
jgi:hypothetical protein